MPTIRPSADLRNKYAEISDYCHTHREPVFITRNGHGDLAVMSIEDYENLVGRSELHRLVDEGLNDLAAGRTDDAVNVLQRVRDGAGL